MTTHADANGGSPTDDPTATLETPLATPEGDNENLPSEPLSSDPPTPLRPRGDEPHSTEPLRKALE